MMELHKIVIRRNFAQLYPIIVLFRGNTPFSQFIQSHSKFSAEAAANKKAHRTSYVTYSELLARLSVNATFARDIFIAASE